MPERWIVRVYGMGCAIPDSYEYRNYQNAQRSMHNSCNGITARLCYLIYVRGNYFELIDQWKYGDGARN